MNQNKQSLISILMPVKNAASFLAATIDSMLKQDYHHWELIAVDDTSTDKSLQILQDHAHKDKRIKVFRNSGHGIIQALSLAFNKSTGDYITRMDADDLMTPNKLSTLCGGLQIHGNGHVATGLVKYFADYPLGEGYKLYAHWLNELTVKGDNYQEIYKECVIPSPCWMLHRTDLIKIGAFDSEIYPEDYDLCFRMMEAGLRVIPSDQVLHLWRDHGERASRNDPNYIDNRFLSIKCFYFNKLHYDSSKHLTLWGAGKKGKWIANWLIKKKIPFTWVCNNPKKIGHNIYGVTLKDSQTLTFDQNHQIIISVAEKGSNLSIKKHLSQYGLENLNHTFAFC